MKKIYALLVGCVLILCYAGNTFGQQKLVTDANKKVLENFAAQKGAEYTASHKKAIELAASHNWVVQKKLKNGGAVSLQRLTANGKPLFIRTHNIEAAAATRTNTVQPGGSSGLNLSGSSTFLQGKLAIWDEGTVNTKHQEFAGKTITYSKKTDGAGISEHTTHVTGTMIAKGIYAPAKGMAFNATTLLNHDFDNDVNEMSTAAPNLLLSNHSYGYEAGWQLNDDGSWTWLGIPGDTVDYAFGRYDIYTQQYDQVAYYAPYYLIVNSAGNTRGYNGPAIGEDYFGYTSATDLTIINKGPRPANISSQLYYDGMAYMSTAKDILTVGAINPLPFGPANPQAVTSADFSSWGPTDDGRIKPDICGMGVNVLSTDTGGTAAYLYLSGTSMSSPNVTGSLYLLQEYYHQKNNAFMLAATLKGLACHTAFDAGNPGPDYIFGWGVLDEGKAAQAITDNGTKSMIKENTLTQGQSQIFKVVASGGGPLVATISWGDLPGDPSLDDLRVIDRSSKLVNDLDIIATDGTNVFKPWVLDPANPGIPAIKGNNVVDNIEQVFIANAIPGKTYTFAVSNKGTLQGNTQNYSLIVTGIGGAAYCASNPTSNADSKITNITLSNINNSPASGCTTYSDYSNLTASLEKGKTYPLSISVGTCGGNFNKVAKVFIDWNGDGNFNGPGELVATSNVINGVGVYTSNITVPQTIVPGTYSLMRVVLTETSDTAAVKACGTYTKGETQDYRVQFINTSIDAGITAITTPDTTSTCPGTTPITVTVKNYGTATLTSIPVKVTITAPDNTVTTINQTYTGTLNSLDEDSFTLNQTFTAAPGAVYTITATTNVANDLVTENNQYTTKVKINDVAVAAQAIASICDTTQNYLLSAQGDGTVLWYTSNTSTTPFAFGSPVLTKVAPVNNTYYVGVNDLSGTVGPATKNVFSAGGYNQFGPSIAVTTKTAMVLQSARIYVGYPGKFTFTVTTLGGEQVSSAVINATATRTNPQPGAQVNDPNDQGQVYNLNLLFPAAGDYLINLGYDNNATIFRNNGGVSGYPFTLDSLFTITGNTAGTGFYYYLYDIQVKLAGCASATRQAVTISKPAITTSDTTLVSNFATGNQWFFNGSLIAGATGSTYTPLKTGNYQDKITFTTGCTALSNTLAFTVNGIPVTPPTTNTVLQVYPVPANTQVTVSIGVDKAGELTLSLINSLGKIVYSNARSVSVGTFTETIPVQDQPPGPYVVKVLMGDKTYAKKIVIHK